jgi:hypothetical protein
MGVGGRRRGKEICKVKVAKIAKAGEGSARQAPVCLLPFNDPI